MSYCHSCNNWPCQCAIQVVTPAPVVVNVIPSTQTGGLPGFSTQGTQGVQGVQGGQGTQGIDGKYAGQGVQGFQGLQGGGFNQAQGTQGLQGIQGFYGIQGSAGHNGVQGYTGTQGATGSQGLQGSSGPQGVQGTDGGGVTLQQLSDAIAGVSLASTDDLPEGATNKYFTVGRVSYIHTQGVASNTWVINHNLGFYPNLTVQDSAGTIYEGEITYTNSNSLTVTFSSAFSGKAYLS